MKRFRGAWLAGLFLIALSLPVSARYLWIETSGDKEAKLCFGQFHAGERERAGGRLDDLGQPELWSFGSSGQAIPLTSTRQDDHFLLSGLGKTVSLLGRAVKHPVVDQTQRSLGMIKPMYYARFQQGPIGKNAQPFLKLDVILTETDGARVFFRERPLAGAKAVVFAPNGKQETKSDAAGFIPVQVSEPGTYVLEVVHKEPSSGTFDGIKYGSTYHFATCTFRKEKEKN